jgi:hypothetical protein
LVNVYTAYVLYIFIHTNIHTIVTVLAEININENTTQHDATIQYWMAKLTEYIHKNLPEHPEPGWNSKETLPSTIQREFPYAEPRVH